MVTTTKSKTSTGAKVTSQSDAPSKKLVPAAPERANVAKKRKRLAKAFRRPLDKQLRKQQTVREKFALPASEYEQLLDLKARLAERGSPVKKSELVRAGLMLLAALDDDELTAVLTRLPASGV